MKLSRTVLEIGARSWYHVREQNLNHHYFQPNQIANYKLFHTKNHSLATKQIVLVELTVPREENISQQRLAKTRKYDCFWFKEVGLEEELLRY